MLLDRIGAAERLAQAVQAVQVHDLAAFNADYLSRGDTAPLDAARDPQLPAAARMAVVEVACELQVAQVTAGCRITTAARAVNDHSDLLDLVGTGRVSMAGLGRVLEKTVVLDPARQRTVDTALAPKHSAGCSPPVSWAGPRTAGCWPPILRRRRGGWRGPVGTGRSGWGTRSTGPPASTPCSAPRKRCRSSPASTAPHVACAPTATTGPWTPCAPTCSSNTSPAPR